MLFVIVSNVLIVLFVLFGLRSLPKHDRKIIIWITLLYLIIHDIFVVVAHFTM